MTGSEADRDAAADADRAAEVDLGGAPGQGLVVAVELLRRQTAEETGAVIGAFIMGVMNNGMSIVGLGIDFQQMVKGLVLLAAVFFDVYNKNKG